MTSLVTNTSYQFGQPCQLPHDRPQTLSLTLSSHTQPAARYGCSHLTDEEMDANITSPAEGRSQASPSFSSTVTVTQTLGRHMWTVWGMPQVWFCLVFKAGSMSRVKTSTRLELITLRSRPEQRPRVGHLATQAPHSLVKCLVRCLDPFLNWIVCFLIAEF